MLFTQTKHICLVVTHTHTQGKVKLSGLVKTKMHTSVSFTVLWELNHKQKTRGKKVHRGRNKKKKKKSLVINTHLKTCTIH